MTEPTSPCTLEAGFVWKTIMHILTHDKQCACLGQMQPIQKRVKKPILHPEIFESDNERAYTSICR
ncbi:hypothetical protein SESBI_32097 [Sesbania bispinosa]|nr:hypothetical protein SESBI_32097 [Sesbania bispinosa]